MKKFRAIALFIMGALLLIGVYSVNAAPFLVCDPDLSGVTEEYVLVLNTGEEIITPAPLHYDLEGLEPGEYVATVWGKNGLWRGPASVPFGFEKPLLLLPTGMGLSD